MYKSLKLYQTKNFNTKIAQSTTATINSLTINTKKKDVTFLERFGVRLHRLHLNRHRTQPESRNRVAHLRQDLGHGHDLVGDGDELVATVDDGVGIDDGHSDPLPGLAGTGDDPVGGGRRRWRPRWGPLSDDGAPVGSGGRRRRFRRRRRGGGGHGEDGGKSFG